MATSTFDAIWHALQATCCPTDYDPKTPFSTWPKFSDRYRLIVDKPTGTPLCLGHGFYGSVFAATDADEDDDSPLYAAKYVAVRSLDDATKLQREIRIMQHLATGKEAAMPGSEKVLTLYDQFIYEVKPEVDRWARPDDARRYFPTTGIRVVLVMEMAAPAAGRPIPPIAWAAKSPSAAEREPPCAAEISARCRELGTPWLGADSDTASWISRAHPYAVTREVIKQVLQGLVFCQDCGQVARLEEDATSGGAAGAAAGGASSSSSSTGGSGGGRIILQRDIKPDNVLIVRMERLPDDADRSGLAAGQDVFPVVKLCDFGLAKVVDEEAIKANTLGIGTKNYMAPELYKDVTSATSTAVYNHKVDSFATGCALFTMATAALPNSDILAGFPSRFSAELLAYYFPTVTLADGRVVDSEQRYLLRHLAEASPAARWDVRTALAFLEAAPDRRAAIVQGLVPADRFGDALNPDVPLATLIAGAPAGVAAPAAPVAGAAAAVGGAAAVGAFPLAAAPSIGTFSDDAMGGGASGTAADPGAAGRPMAVDST